MIHHPIKIIKRHKKINNVYIYIYTYRIYDGFFTDILLYKLTCAWKFQFGCSHSPLSVQQYRIEHIALALTVQNTFLIKKSSHIQNYIAIQKFKYHNLAT